MSLSELFRGAMAVHKRDPLVFTLEPRPSLAGSKNAWPAQTVTGKMGPIKCYEKALKYMILDTIAWRAGNDGMNVPSCSSIKEFHFRGDRLFIACYSVDFSEKSALKLKLGILKIDHGVYKFLFPEHFPDFFS